MARKKKTANKKPRPSIANAAGEKVDPVDVAGAAAPYIIFLEKKVEILVGLYAELEKIYGKVVETCERAGRLEEEIEDDPEIQQFLGDEDLDDDPEYE